MSLNPILVQYACHNVIPSVWAVERVQRIKRKQEVA